MTMVTTHLQERPVNSATFFRYPVLQDYFEGLNRGDFPAVAGLFAPQGELIPPFETPIVGAQAIAAYLQQEAQGLQLFPQEETHYQALGGTESLTLQGRVQTPLFSVKVAWQFQLASPHQIQSVEVKLLASLAELSALPR